MSLKNSQYDAIMRNYSQKQFENKAKQDLRYQEVYHKIPEFQKIEHSISSLSIGQAKKLLTDGHASMHEYHEKMERLKQQRTTLLAQYGFPADYLELTYHCRDCKDQGYIGNRKCHCFLQEEIDLLYSQTTIKELLKQENFENFSDQYYSRTLTDPNSGASAYEMAHKALKQCKNFVKNFSSSYENILLYGNTGVGKTFLTNCIAKALLDRCHSVLYFSATTLFDTLAKNTFEQRLDEVPSSSYILDCDLLIIDDLGTEMSNSFVLSKFFEVINERHLRRKSTLISTNLSMETLKDIYTERTFSRIFGNYILIKLIGNDIRIQKKLTNK